MFFNNFTEIVCAHIFSDLKLIETYFKANLINLGWEVTKKGHVKDNSLLEIENFEISMPDSVVNKKLFSLFSYIKKTRFFNLLKCIKIVKNLPGLVQLCL